VWREDKPARLARKEADAALFEQIVRVWKASGEAYGSPRVTVDLRREGMVVNEKRVARLMSEGGIEGRSWKPKRPVTTVPDPDAETVPDRLKRRFNAEAVGEKYVSDLTYLPLADGSFLYLTTVIDLCSRRVAGWSITDHMRADAMVDALDAARRLRGSLEGSIVHSDNGSQGGFNWSLQHLDLGGVDGQASGMDEGTDGPVADEVAGTAVGQPARAATLVLGQDRRRIVQRGSCGHKWHIDALGAQMVP
jgi:hypothetical protein